MDLGHDPKTQEDLGPDFRKDTPAFRDDVGILEARVRTLHEHGQKVDKMVADYNSQVRQSSQSSRQVSATCSQCKSFFGSKSSVDPEAPAGSSLLYVLPPPMKSTKDALTKLLKMMNSLESISGGAYKMEATPPAKDINWLAQKKTMYEKSREEYLAASSKALSVNDDAGKEECNKLDTTARTVKAFYELQRYDYYTCMQEALVGKQEDLLQQMSTFLHSQVNFIQKAHELLQDILPELAEVDKLLEETKKANEEKENANKTLRRKVERAIAEEASGPEPDWDSLGVKELKMVLEENSVACTGMVEKAELVTSCKKLWKGPGEKKMPQALAAEATNQWAVAVHSTDVTEKRGFLMLKEPGMVKSSWERMWVVLEGGVLSWWAESDWKRHPKASVDMLLATVKEVMAKSKDTDRCRFVIQIVTPQMSYYLQANNEAIKNSWVSALRGAIGAQLNAQVVGPKSEDKKTGVSFEDDEKMDKDRPRNRLDRAVSRSIIMPRLRSIAGNDVCADCDTTNPEWAVINLGILICSECSGVHRSIGTHISKVRSITLDSWTSELIELMEGIGNEESNKIWEYGYATEHKSQIRRPQAGASRAARDEYIRAKYVDKKFLPLSWWRSAAGSEQAGELHNILTETTHASIDNWHYLVKDDQLGPVTSVRLYELFQTGDITKNQLVWNEDMDEWKPACQVPELEKLLLSIDEEAYVLVQHNRLSAAAVAICGMGANSNWNNPNDRGKTFLHEAVYRGYAGITELLTLNGANLDQVDSMNWTPLHYAAAFGRQACATMLLNKGCNSGVANVDNMTALQVAQHQENTDLVTMLEQVKDTAPLEPHQEAGGAGGARPQGNKGSPGPPHVQGSKKDSESSMFKPDPNVPGQLMRVSIAELDESLNKEVTQGWMEKRGDKSTMGRVSWKRRWFVLRPEKRELTYFDELLGGKLKGSIDLTKINAVRPVPNPEKDHEGAFEIITPGRTWVLCPVDDASTAAWVTAIKEAHRPHPAQASMTR